MNIELILVLLTAITFVLLMIDQLFLAPKRKQTLAPGQAAEPTVVKAPLVFDYARSLFPVFLIVLLIRSFLYEPFRIPSPSLEPTLLTGDFIAVNKFIYGVRLPVIHTKIIPFEEPKRGDIMVFRWPPNPNVNYIKRIIGLPGDKISYVNRQLTINGQVIPQTLLMDNAIVDSRSNPAASVVLKDENLLGIQHYIFQRPEAYSTDLYDIVVPPSHYFVMGDNRDDSADSRDWGFVPEANIVGRADMIWMSWNGPEKDIRWNRLGKGIH